ncbi:MAG: PH domain-containing protein [Actinotalea sp.]|nr:PH domain-containing protein [Actinotalea sp.]
MGPTYVFSSTFGRVLTAATAGVALAATLAVLGDLALRDVLTTVLASALGTLLVWAAFARPAVEVSDGEVVLVNVTRTVRIPWPLLERAEARWSLEVHTTDGRRWTAWAAPRSSAAGGAMRARRGGAQDTGRRPATAEGVQAAIDERQAALLSAGHLDGSRALAEAAGLRVTVSWHRATIAAVVVLTGAVVATRVL